MQIKKKKHIGVQKIEHFEQLFTYHLSQEAAHQLAYS